MENRGYGRVYTYRKEDGMGYGVYDPEKVFFIPDENGNVFVNDVRCRVVNKNDTSIEKVVVDGVPFVNYFYTDNNGVVRSTLVNSIKLPNGYSKLDYIYNGIVSSKISSILTTNCKINSNFGSIYLGFKTSNTTPVVDYCHFFQTEYQDEQHNITRAILDQKNTTRIMLYSDIRAGSGGNIVIVDDNLIFFEITSSNKYRRLTSETLIPFGNETQGTYCERWNLCFLSKGFVSNMYYLFVVDENKKATYIFIPCIEDSTGIYGIYEIITGQFFGDSILVGA